MHKLFILIFGTGIAALLMAENVTLYSLDDLQWKNRIIVVDEATETIVGELEARKTEMEERQLLWFCIVNGQVRTNYGGELSDDLMRQIEEDYLRKSGSPVLLIGKDGGIKSRDQQLDFDDYLAQIDSMPMRQSEMRSSATD